MEYIEINGEQVSRIGLGTWAIGGSEWGEVDEDDAIRTCLAIFNHGINLIDTAPHAQSRFTVLTAPDFVI